MNYRWFRVQSVTSINMTCEKSSNGDGPASKRDAESALVILVPEAESLVKSFRDKYDTSAAEGMPAHITVLYPFKTPDEVDDVVRDGLRSCLSNFSPFTFSLNVIRRFPGLLYIAPVIDEPFRELTTAIWSLHPETPPYGGKFAEVIPHLTVASINDQQELSRVSEELTLASREIFPIIASCSEVVLMDNIEGRWQVSGNSFSLRRVFC